MPMMWGAIGLGALLFAPVFWLPNPQTFFAIKIMLLIATAICVIFLEFEVVCDARQFAWEAYFAPTRKRLFTRTILWADEPKISFHRVAFSAKSARFNVFARIVPSLKQQLKLKMPLALLLHHWILEEDAAAYEVQRLKRGFWRIGYDSVTFSDAQHLFKLHDVFQEQG